MTEGKRGKRLISENLKEVRSFKALWVIKEARWYMQSNREMIGEC